MKISIFLLSLLLLTQGMLSNLIQDLQGSLNNKERDLKQQDLKEIKTTTLCDVNMIKAYGLQGIQDSIKREHIYCPAIRDNCCTLDDEVHSMNFWLQKIQGPLENRYRLYYETISYLIGFYEQAEELGKDLEFQSNEVCRASARQFLSLSFNKNMANYILNEIQDSLKRIADLRKGFFCMICDAQTSKTLYSFWQTSDNRFKDRMYYSQDFCQNLVSNNLKAAYYVQRYVRYYVEYLANMIKCKLNLDEDTSFEISRSELTRVKNCILYGDRFFFFFCEKFCEEFSITQINPIFDGYITQLKPFYSLVKQHRKNVFFYPLKNLFINDVSKSEAYIEKQYDDSGKLEIFAKSSQQTFRFDEMTTDFVVNGGLDLHESVNNSLYELNYKSTKIITIVFIILSFFQFKIQRLQFTMKLIFIFAYIIERYFHKDFTDFQCVSEIMQFYGFEGLENPISYQKLVPNMNNDYCPTIKESCCSRLDFQKTQRLWDVKALNIKLYLSKIFKSIQKITVLQSSLLQLAKSVREKDSDQCREVDFTFFNSPIKYNEVYFYLQNALEAFAYMQRGFYCMLCDASQHQYLAIQSAQTRRLNIISHKFCNDLVFFFREFLMFKVYYLDPLMVNTNLLFNCLTDTDTYSYNFFYNASYASLNDCLENGEQCEYTCKEFKFGTSGNLFIGRLHEYMEFIQQIEDTISKFGHNIEVDSFKPLDELFIDDKEYSREFFLDWEQGIQDEKDISLKFFNMTQMEIDVKEEGINLFDIAFKSNYFLTNSLTQKVVRKSYNIFKAGSDKQINGGTRLDEYSNENKNMPEIFNQQRVQEEFEKEDQKRNDFIQNQMANPNRPSKADLLNYYDEQQDKDYQLDRQFRDSLKNDEFASGNIIDFGRAGEVPIHMSTILLSCFLSTLFLFQQLIQQIF